MSDSSSQEYCLGSQNSVYTSLPGDPEFVLKWCPKTFFLHHILIQDLSSFDCSANDLTIENEKLDLPGKFAHLFLSMEIQYEDLVMQSSVTHWHGATNSLDA